MLNSIFNLNADCTCCGDGTCCGGEDTCCGGNGSCC